MIFLVSSGKMAFLLLGGKWKMIVLKNKWKYDVFCIFGKDGISFSYKHEITLLSKKQRLPSPEKYT